MALAGLVSLVLGLALQPLTIRLLRRHGALDRPSERSSHVVPTVRGGGVAVIVALLLGAFGVNWAEGTTGSGVILVLLAVIVLCALVGLAEDLYGVPVVPRLALLLAATSLLALLPTGGTAIRAGWSVVAVIFAVAVVNATNFMDGINGISAAQGIATGTVYAFLAHGQGLDGLVAVALATVGAALSFVPFNVPTARVFLGDCGSYGLGAAFAGTAVTLLAAGLPAEAVLAPLGLTMADTGSALLRRIRKNEDWHLPHRTHTYQQLTDCGVKHVHVSGLVLLVILGCSVLGSASFEGLPIRLAADAGILLLLGAYLALPKVLRGRLENRVRCADPGPSFKMKR